jgi:hypothetical protein
MGPRLHCIGRSSITTISTLQSASASAERWKAPRVHIAAALVLAALGCDDLGPTNAELRPGVRFGADLLEVEQFARCDETGAITDLAYGRVRGDGPDKVVAAGIRGFGLLDPGSPHVERVVLFPNTGWTVPGHFVDARIHDLDADGVLEFLRVAGDRAPLSIHGGEGAARWTDDELVRRADVGDVDGDGKLEILVTSVGQAGVRLLDASGTLRWQQEWFPWFPVFVDVNGDGTQDILYNDAEALWARDGRGEVLARLTLPRGGIANGVFAIPSWQDADRISLVGREYLGNGLDSESWSYSLRSDLTDVTTELDFEALRPLLHAIPIEFSGTTAAWATLRYLQRPAPVAGIAATRVRLTLFDRAGSAVYDEVLRAPEGERTFGEGSMLFLAGQDGRPARLLVAYGTGVWTYRARH